MTTTDNAVVGQVVSLPIELVVPDPNNPRVDLRAIEQMRATIVANVERGGRGLLEPIHVRRLPDVEGAPAGFMVVRGHRRLAGCQAAKLSYVDAIIVSAEQAERERSIDRLVENMQRDDFTATETATAVQQLLDLGMTVEEVTTSTALTADDVAAASTVAASKGVAVVAKRMDISMDQAAALAEFEGDKDAFKTLTTTLHNRPHYFDQQLAQYRNARAAAAKQTKAAADWTAKGYAVLTWAEVSKDPTVPLYAVKADKGKAASMTVAAHAKCPGRAVVLSGGHGASKVAVEHYCTDPEANGHRLRYERRAGSVSAPKGTKTEKELLEGRVHRAGMAASRVAREVRVDFVRRLLLNVKPPKGLVPFTVAQLVTERTGMDSRVAPVFGELSGVSADKGHYGGTEAQAALLAKCRGRELMVLLARVCAEREYAWESNTWAKTSDEQRRPYLAFLVANGYTPSTVENVLLGQAKGADVLAEMDRVRAAAKLAPKVKPAKAAAKNGAGHRTAVKRAPARRVAKRRAPTKRAAVKRVPARKRAASR